MVIGLMIHNRSARSNEEKRKSSWKRALTSRSSAAISFTDLARQEDRASSSQVVGWTNFDVWERPQHVECVDTISRVRRYYSDFWEQCAENSWGASRDNDDDDFHPELPEDLREAIEREYDELIPYKGRNLKGRPLHFALWVASLSDSNPLGTDGLEDVKVLLWAKAEPNSSATYFRRAEVVSLPALHIAAGLGCIPAMGMILDHTGNSLEEVNRFCCLDGFCGEREFYCALHDAVFNGKAKAAVWLLEQHADPSVKNMEGFSALHWLALRSMDEDQDVEEVVRCLIRSGASVEQNTEEGKIPLEMAVKPGSLFPKHLLYLLAPSYQALDGGRSLMNCSFFEDLALMSSHSGKAAQDFADRIATLPAASAKHKVIKDAQHENAVDCMASLLQMAPEAAAGMLGLLLAKPIQESPGHHSLSSRAILWGRTLQCTYQPDQRITRLGPRQDRVRWPEWKYNATLGHAPAWHSKLLKVPQEHQARSAKVFDVVEQVHTVDVISQVLKPQFMPRDRVVPKISTQVQERVVHVPQVLVEEQAIELPQANIVEVIREDLAPVYQEVVKQVPKVHLDYIERVVEVETAAVNETSPAHSQVLPPGSRYAQEPSSMAFSGARSSPVPSPVPSQLVTSQFWPQSCVVPPSGTVLGTASLVSPQRSRSPSPPHLVGVPSTLGTGSMTLWPQEPTAFGNRGT
eukprot:s153_g4.t2